MTFNCEHCDASYPVRKSLLNNKRLKHGDAKQFACQQCVYATTNRSHYERHVRSKHEKVKEICEVCGKGFSDRSNLIKHIRTFHPAIKTNDEESVGVAIETKRKATDTLENQPKKSKGSM